MAQKCVYSLNNSILQNAFSFDKDRNVKVFMSRAYQANPKVLKKLRLLIQKWSLNEFKSDSALESVIFSTIQSNIFCDESNVIAYTFVR